MAIDTLARAIAANKASKDVAPSAPAQLLKDDFTDGTSRPFVSGTRVPEIGATPWTVTGGSYLFAKVGGASGFIGTPGQTGKIYGVTTLSETPSEIGGVFQWPQVVDGILEPPTIACIKSGDENTFANMWHCLFAAIGNQISNCQFDQTYWMAGTPAVRPVAAINRYGPVRAIAGNISLSTGVDYIRRVRFYGSWCIATIEAMDGTVLAQSEAYDPNLPAVIGRSLFIETSNSSLQWKRVWAYGDYNKISSETRKFPGGVDDTPIGMNIPRPITGSVGLFGAGAPATSAPFTVGLRNGEHAAVLGRGVSPDFRIYPTSAGYGSRLTLGAWGGVLSNLTLDYDGAYNTILTNKGVVSLGQNYADKHWYFQAGIRLGGASGRLINSATAPPTSGSYVMGDRVFNSIPAVGSPKSWVCTASGSPGTWVSEGVL